ncbi:fumarylacetoacetate hydrolase family protein [Labrys sedimenti]|uniref:fumarylacetoacetate hydrolase family protein n=1 Tax=Labrys sedimenti TaxID=3106036 RepID=UPI002ACA2CF2|nr:fumarylacetoacetate hydrolase family protein [Labrys sp. ZIDIC5]MDZ5453192.1 fumarylacetoacetate hydrolase family protein [Labrys sp. ZIDIC5]
MRASVAELGEALAFSRSGGSIGDLPLHLISSEQMAEDVQDVAVAALDDNIAGYCATATIPATRRILQCEEAVFGPLTASSMLADRSHFRLPPGVLGAEWSLGLLLGDSYPDPHRPATPSLIEEAIIGCVPMITILGRRVKGVVPLNSWTATADFGLHSASVKGAPVYDRHLADLKGLEVVASMNGAVVGRSRGETVMSDVREAIAHLSLYLARRGRQVPPGNLIAIGGGPLILQAVVGQAFVADFGGLGTVEVVFA